MTGEMKTERAGEFVSIHENGELRGCIGTIAATRKNLAEEIVANAIAASTRDPRFPEIRKERRTGLSGDQRRCAERSGSDFLAG